MKALLALDLQAVGVAALDEALPWVERFGAVADVVYVTGFESPDRFFTDPNLKDMALTEWEGHKEKMRAKLNAWLERIPAGFRGEALVVDGAPAHAIAGLSPRYDLVIVATHGYRGLRHLWHGSVAEDVARASSAPVMVLRLAAAPEA